MKQSEMTESIKYLAELIHKRGWYMMLKDEEKERLKEIIESE